MLLVDQTVVINQRIIWVICKGQDTEQHEANILPWAKILQLKAFLSKILGMSLL